MKKLLMLLVAGTLVLSITGCKKPVEEPTAPNPEEMKKVGDGAADAGKKEAGKAVDDAAAKAKEALK